MLAGCASVPLPPHPPGHAPAPAPPAAAPQPAPVGDPAAAAPLLQGKSRWLPVRWSELPGFDDDALHEAWNAWIRSCERPGAGLRAAVPARCGSCPSPRADEQRAWMRAAAAALPRRAAAGRQPTACSPATTSRCSTPRASRRRASSVPLYRPPAGLAQRKPWYTPPGDRHPARGAGRAARARDRLAGRPARRAGAADPGLGPRCASPSPTARSALVRAGLRRQQRAALPQRRRLAAAAGRAARCVLARHQGLGARSNPQRVQRDAVEQPAHGVLPRGAADRARRRASARAARRACRSRRAARSRSTGTAFPTARRCGWPPAARCCTLQRLVLAQDTGSAIVGAVRADYFAGWGAGGRRARRAAEAAAAAVGALAEVSRPAPCAWLARRQTRPRRSARRVVAWSGR